MITKQDLIYRQLITLRDGGRVLLRPLMVEDRQALLDFFAEVSPEDLKFMRHQVNDPKVINRWFDELDYDKVFPLVALFGDRIVGEATLHFKQGPYRHRAEVRIFLAKEARSRGVGARMIEALIDLAKRRNLVLLDAQVITEQTKAVKAFQNLGFELKAVLDDFFMLPDGDLRDMALLVLRLRTSGGEF